MKYIFIILIAFSCTYIEVPEITDRPEPFGEWIRTGDVDLKYNGTVLIVDTSRLYLSITQDSFLFHNHIEVGITAIKHQIGVADGILYVDNRLLKKIPFFIYNDELTIKPWNYGFVYTFERM